MTRLATIVTTLALACTTVAADAQCPNPAFFRAEGTAAGNVRFFRAVNDFVLPLGNEGNYRVTELSARIATNCQTGAEVWFEVFASDSAGRPASRIGLIKAATVVPTGRTFTISNLTQAEVLASVTVPSTVAIGAAAGKRIWVGAFVKDTFSFMERGNAIADSANPVSTKAPMLKTSSTGSWTSAPAGTCDLAISVCARQFCRADLNEDGLINRADWILYMQAWLAHSALADFNRNGLISVEDRNEFFAAYNSGCTPISWAL